MISPEYVDGLELRIKELAERLRAIKWVEADEAAGLIESLRGNMADLILAGNRLARGEVTADAWHAAVRAATPAPICIYNSSEDIKR